VKKIKNKPITSIQMIENGYMVYFEGTQTFYPLLRDCFRDVGTIMSNYLMASKSVEESK